MKNYEEIKNKVEYVWGVLNKRLPKGYCTPVKCYSSIYYLLKAVGEYLDRDYEEIKYIYNHYCDDKTKKTDYVETKYYRPKSEVRHREECFYCDAFAGDAVWIACDNISCHSDAEIAFLLLHEFCHKIYETDNEKKCDDFAIRWVRKLQKEGAI